MDFEQLVFIVRSVAEGADKGFKAAEEAAERMDSTYKKVVKTEDDLSKAIQSLTTQLASSTRSQEADTKALRDKVTALELSQKELQEVAKAEQERALAAEKTAAKLRKAAEEEAKAARERAKAEAEAARQQREQQVQIAATIAVIYGLIKAYRMASSFLNEMTMAYVQNRNAMIGLRSIAEGTGQDMGTINKSVQDLTNDGLIPLAQASTAVKNLLARGFNAQEAIDIINRLKDAAAFGRQASYSLADAVATATEGLKNENSILVDNAGVTKNVAKMWLDYAKAHGISTEAMTLAQKREAEYLGIMEETRHQVGDAAKLSGEFAGSQASLEAATLKLKVALGEANAQGLAPMMTLLAGLTRGTAEFVSENKRIVAFGVNFTKAVIAGVAALMLFRGGFRTLIADMAKASPVIGAVTRQIATLKGVMSGPWGWVTLGISVAIGLFSALSGESARAAERLRELNEEASELAKQTSGAGALVEQFERLSKKTIKTKEETAEMDRISSKLVESYGFRADGVDAEGRLLLTNLGYMKEQLAVQRELSLLKLEEAEKANRKSIQDAIQKRIEAEKSFNSLQKQLKEAEEDLKAKEAELWRISQIPGHLGARQAQIDVERALELVQQIEPEYKEALQTLTQTPEKIAEHIQRSLMLAKARIGESASEIPATVQATITQGMTEALRSGEMVDSETAQAFMESFLKLDAEAIKVKAIPELEVAREQIIAALVTSDVGEDAKLNIANELIEGLTSDETLQKAMAESSRLGQAIADGTASSAERVKFDELQQKITSSLDKIRNQISETLSAKNIPLGDIDKAFDSLGKRFSIMSADIENTSSALRAQKSSVKDMVGAIGSLSGAYESLNKQIQDVTDLQVAIDVLREGDKASRDYGLALEYLADRYGVTADQVAANLDEYQKDADMKAIMIELNYQLAIAEANMAIATAQAMVAAGTATQDQANKIIFALQGVLDKLSELDGASAKIDVDGDGKIIKVNKPSSTRTGRKFTPTWQSPKSSSSKRSSSAKKPKAATKAQDDKNEALERELKLLERKKRLDQVTTDEEIAQLLLIRRLHAKTADERAEIDDRLYQLQKEKVQQAYELDVYYGRLTLEQQRERIRAMVNTHKKGTTARIDLEKQLYEIQKQIADRDRENLSKLAEGVTSALRARYEAQRQQETETIRQSAEAWQEWARAQQQAIRDQISALDELTKGEDRADEEKRRRRKIAALEQQLQYENDAYNQRKLEEQIAKEQADLDKWLERNRREDMKAELQKQSEEVAKRAQAEQDALQKQLDELEKFYDERLKEHNLSAEAEHLMMTGSQKDIIQLIQSFAPAYDAVGKSLGERLYEGFVAQAKNIPAWFDSITKQISDYQDKMAQSATQAAITFWDKHGMPRHDQTPSDPGRLNPSVPPQIILNFYQPIESPAAMSREAERMIERITRRG